VEVVCRLTVAVYTGDRLHGATHILNYRGLPPANHLATPANHLATPANHLATPANHLATPANHLATPANYLATPANYLATPAKRLVKWPELRVLTENGYFYPFL
jgi:hypothetical protein